MRAACQFQIFPSTGVPIYRQLMEQVMAQIGSGSLAAGTFLPTVREVAENLQINPMTVSKAYSLLERDGYLELLKGQGMRVNSKLPMGDKSKRGEALKPVLQQVIARALQLQLKPREVEELMKPYLEKLKNEYQHAGNEKSD